MKLLAAALATLALCFVSPAQDPVTPKKDHIYVEFITDCSWLVYGLEGKFKLHPQHNNAVGFRAWAPYLSPKDVDIRGFAIWRNIDASLGIRDAVVFPWSAIKIEFPFPPGSVPFKWDFMVHYNEMSGRGVPNAETHMRVWGPCQLVTLYHGEAMVKHGGNIEYIKVDENDYLNYPPWSIQLK